MPCFGLVPPALGLRAAWTAWRGEDDDDDDEGAGTRISVLTVAAVTRPGIAPVLERWEHVLFPTVLICLGVAILLEGDAFGL